MLGLKMPGDQSFKFLLAHVLTTKLYSTVKNETVGNMYRHIKAEAKKLLQGEEAYNESRSVHLEFLEPLEWEFQFPLGLMDPQNLIDFYGDIDRKVLFFYDAK